MNKTYSFFYTQILFTVYFTHIDYCKVYAGDLKKQESKLNTLIEKLHSMYKDAFENEKTHITRRFFTKGGQSHYTLHVQKLKEVDGVKTHNLRLEQKSKQKDPIIYINNPVEARMPNPFLNIKQFKSAMFERVEKQKKEFDINRNLLRNANKQFKVFKHLEVVPTKIFDVNKYVKQVADASNNMKTRGNHKVNKKRKRKVNFSHATIKSETKPHIMTTAALPKETVLDSSETFEEKITTNDSVAVDTADGEINNETIAVEKITREIPDDEEVTNETATDEIIAIQKTVGHEITAETTADDGITTETVADEVINTVTTAAEEINTEIISSKEITTEMIDKEEIITELTTTKPTVRTTKTRQLRPFVFMGER